MVRRIAVVGQGLMGLTSAAKLLDHGFDITVFSRDSLEQTTSMSAGAYWWPHKTYPNDKVRRWAKLTWDEYARQRSIPESGVHFEEHFRFCIDPDESAWILELVDEWQQVDGEEYGFSCADAFRAVLPVIDVPVFMRNLKHRVEKGNAEFVSAEIVSPTDLFPEFDLVVNCTGLGARDFAGDADVFPIRGQVVRVARPAALQSSTRVYRQDDQFTLILPRSTDVILGGTCQYGDWDRTIRPDDSEAILQRCADAVPSIRNAQVLGAAVGLRPGRDVVRLELEEREAGAPVVHNYGHGGGGYTVAWGCADDVTSLVRQYFA